ncbi:MAG: YcbK family protein [Vicinamibacteria bacterium]
MSLDLTSRRGFLGVAAATAAGLLLPRGVFAQPRAPRVLRFDHLHTGEKLAIEYWKGGTYESQSLDAINHLMRDFRTGDVHPIDPPLLDLLHDLAEVTGTSRPFEIISAYRSPATNAFLHQHSDGVASHSLHLKGMAIDIRLDDVRLKDLRRAALDARRGGVGYYPGSNFVHVDTGRVRTW